MHTGSCGDLGLTFIHFLGAYPYLTLSIKARCFISMPILKGLCGVLEAGCLFMFKPTLVTVALC